MSSEARPLAQPPAGQPRESVAPAPEAGGHLAPARSMRSDQLFNGATELLIDHHGVLYRLKHTALGKLILTK